MAALTKEKLSQYSCRITNSIFPELTSIHYLQKHSIKSEQERRGIVAAAISWTKTTAITPSFYENNLLQQYIEGMLTIDQIIELFEENNENTMK